MSNTNLPVLVSSADSEGQREREREEEVVGVVGEKEAIQIRWNLHGRVD